ncbi:MAG: V-type ATP synthase subunit F [Nitrososphaerales archaeon]
MRVIAIGGQSFVTGFMLSGVEGHLADNPPEALQKVSELSRRDDVSLLVVSDDISEPIREELNEIRLKKSIPVIYELPGPNSHREPVDYKQMLKKVLGI